MPATDPVETRQVPRGWPFFAPSQAGAISAALDLSGVGAGTWFVDLGCGEGHVLVAAARRGAHVTGIECDSDLAGTARQALEDAGLTGDVVVGDLFDPSSYADERGTTPDVLFSYLSPATLQRLTPVLASLPGSRFVTIDFDVPDLVADRTLEPARLYDLPGTPRPPDPDAEIGWPVAGTMCVMPPDVNSLTCLEVLHPGGPVHVTLRGGLARHAALATGADRAKPGQPLAIDLRWRERSEGILAHGTVEVEGLRPHPLTVLFAAADQGQWDLSPDGCADLDARLRQRNLPRPTTTRQLLSAMGVDVED